MRLFQERISTGFTIQTVKFGRKFIDKEEVVLKKTEIYIKTQENFK